MFKIGDNVVIITNNKGMYGVEGVVRRVDMGVEYCDVEFSYGIDKCKFCDIQAKVK